MVTREKDLECSLQRLICCAIYGDYIDSRFTDADTLTNKKKKKNLIWDPENPTTWKPDNSTKKKKREKEKKCCLYPILYLRSQENPIRLPLKSPSFPMKALANTYQNLSRTNDLCRCHRVYSAFSQSHSITKFRSKSKFCKGMTMLSSYPGGSRRKNNISFVLGLKFESNKFQLAQNLFQFKYTIYRVLLGFLMKNYISIR